jgi:aerobic-type carbon monoxide dehydrogenase small subunit (CoxS/CutS family)
MSQITLEVNGKDVSVDVDPATPLLWALRDGLGLVGTKYGCGEGICGACTVHIEGNPQRSCILPVSQAVGHQITTIVGLSPDGTHPLQKAWLAENVAQCGYCQPGQIMTGAALLAKNPHPTDADIDAAMAGNWCRCGSYQRIRRAIHRVANQGGAS